MPLDIDSNTNTAISFNGGLDLTTSTGIAFEASGNTGGLIRVSATSGTEQLTATDGTALSVDGAALDLTFDSTSSANSAGDGIAVIGASGQVTVNGGTISNPGTIGVFLSHNTANTAFTGLTVTGAPRDSRFSRRSAAVW